MYSEFMDLFPVNRIKFNEPLKNHTSFAIGGPADLMFIPESIEELRKVIFLCQKQQMKYFILGQGSNILVRDKGIRGVVIKLNNILANITVDKEQITAEAGISISNLAQEAARHELSGLEFAEGIPGSLGGAVVMNAGAYGGEMKNVLLEVTAINKDGNIKKYTPDEMLMTYRKSIFQFNGSIVVSAVIKLQKDKKESIKARMDDYAARRQEKQPLDFPSAGSTFRRPENYFVGPMIEELGLKGFKIGGAQVSAKHAGFIINSGNASARDVLELIAYIQKKVRERYGVELQTEIKVVGEE
ncbi:MAG: UDP-N-acetylmuramate dehydrogenase [Syntrophomonadaceae bacterium]|nr:UDP-N-acetylmuramate dehydrogenase [Syntrophomonadaceae bacterium]MDD3023712.1 UDP-N-acetylmuramate dehydrogenase [Syntrophomonadaceae bacterium]